MELSGVSLRLPCAGALLCGAGISAAQIASIPASSSPVQTIPATNEANPFAGSVPTKAVAVVLPLSLREAINRGLRQNFGLLLPRADIRSARGQRWQELSALLQLTRPFSNRLFGVLHDGVGIDREIQFV